METGAYLGALVRTASGGFRLEDAISFEALREHAADGPEGIARALRPIDAGLEDLPHAPITTDEIRRLGEGLITAPKKALVLRDAPLVLAVGPDGRVVAVCRAVAGALYPHKVLADRPATAGRPDARVVPDPD
jgi:tRNA U55 pseudouridine synthase TruB